MLIKEFDQLTTKQKETVKAFYTKRRFPRLNSNPRAYVYYISEGKIAGRKEKKSKQ